MLIGNFLAGRFSVRVGLNRMVLMGTDHHHGRPGVLTLLTLAGLSGPVMFFALTVLMGIGNGLACPTPTRASCRCARSGRHRLGPGRRDHDRRRRGSGRVGRLALAAGSSEMPLILLMLASSLGSVFAILMVIRRARAWVLPLDACSLQSQLGLCKWGR
jgi:DHA1 family bicyclomycin/chloramphenicol resistance-like MFS transporter